MSRPALAPMPLALKAGRPLVMGVVNVTPDSFYAGSRTPSVETAIAAGLRFVEEGADILDIGGQSTRPGSEPVSVDVELSRVIPVVEALAAQTSLPISVDTDKPEVARAALRAGASVLNDIRGLRQPGMAEIAVEYANVVIMHMGGESPKTMQLAPSYTDVVVAVKEFFASQKQSFVRAGGKAERLLIDPGLGFGKTFEHNMTLLRRLDELAALAPVLVGASRKSFIGKLAKTEDPAARLEGSLAAACLAATKGASIVRVHDVLATRRAFDVLAAIGDAP